MRPFLFEQFQLAAIGIYIGIGVIAGSRAIGIGFKAWAEFICVVVVMIFLIHRLISTFRLACLSLPTRLARALRGGRRGNRRVIAIGWRALRILTLRLRFVCHSHLVRGCRYTAGIIALEVSKLRSGQGSIQTTRPAQIAQCWQVRTRVMWRRKIILATPTTIPYRKCH